MSKTIELKVPRIPDYAVAGVLGLILGVSTLVLAFNFTDGREMTEGREIVVCFTLLASSVLSIYLGLIFWDGRKSSLQSSYWEMCKLNQALRASLDIALDDNDKLRNTSANSLAPAKVKDTTQS